MLHISKFSNCVFFSKKYSLMLLPCGNVSHVLSGFLDEIFAYAQHTHLIFGTVKDWQCFFIVPKIKYVVDLPSKNISKTWLTFGNTLYIINSRNEKKYKKGTLIITHGA